MYDDKPTERGRERLNFVEQLEDQINNCRKAMSINHPDSVALIETLENLLFAHLEKDKVYVNSINKFAEGLSEEYKKVNSIDLTIISNKKRARGISNNLVFQQSKHRFREIMKFIDRKKLMPIGEEE